MGTAISSPFSYWRSEATKSSSDNNESCEAENQPTCDPKSVNGHSNESGDEDSQDQDGGNLDGNNVDTNEKKDEESDDNHASPEFEDNADNKDQDHHVSSANGGENGVEVENESEANLKNGQNGNYDETMESVVNDSNPIILLNDIGDARNEFSSEFAAAKAAYTARANKVIMGQRQSQLTKESRKRDHSADSDRSTPSFQSNMAYLNDIPIANRGKRQKSSETDSVSSRSDSVSAEIEQITSKVAKSRKRRAKTAKKYLS